MRRNLNRRQQILDLRNQDMTRRQIANCLGIPKNLVDGYLHQMIQEGIVAPISKQESIRRRKTASSKVDVAEARRMRTDGESFNEIGKHFGVSSSTITNLIGTSVRITPIQRQLLELRLQDLTIEKIAAQTGKAKGTVAVILSRLVKKGLIPAKRKTKK